MKWKGSILTVWLIKIFWVLNGSYLYWTENNKPGIIQVILIKKLEKDETVQTLINVKKIKFFLCSSWCYFFPLAIFGLCLACKWERGIKSSISDDRTIPLFMLGICYLKNMQAILLKTSKLMKTRKKKSEDCAAGKSNFPVWNLSVTLQHCFDYELCTLGRGQQYCFLSPVSLLKSLSFSTNSSFKKWHTPGFGASQYRVCVLNRNSEAAK